MGFFGGFGSNGFGGFGDIGSGVSSLFSASGDRAKARGLDEAANYEDMNAKISIASTDIKKTAAQRQIYKAIGGQAADIGHAGFSMEGTAVDLARSSAQEGSLTQSMIEAQGGIETQGYFAQAASDRAQAAAARKSAQGSMLSGVLSIGMGIFSLFSDERLKENIKFLGVGKNGHRMYEYNYKPDPETKYVGYMAQEVEKVEPDMVIDIGLKMIDSEYAPQKVS